MDGSPALLLLLALGLCCPGIHGHKMAILEPWYEMNVRFRDSITQVQLGQRLELECQTDKDSDMFWVRQDRNGTLHVIVLFSSLSGPTFEGNQRTSTRFEASRDNRFYRLVVKSFTQQDEGIYFCLMNINRMLYFSNGQPAFLPVTTTLAPSTPGPTTQHGITEKDPCIKTLAPETTMQEELKSFCHIFIWAPLTGLCLLTLQLLVITIVLRQRNTHHNPL
ncbi:T-cell surface glycoprotein CD8 alpha chain-like [Myiozetetes cayanensis]|uniref:T-cell surface glycoprotein CD8 alpha chain-like n=1 Tax=Myiozetetes cayanensis TaxID=478635 RepID=UPI002160F24D|nr:T-cell surface glycoprotein CD8 alpha chain-like [Myiozetetes cayanensis]